MPSASSLLHFCIGTLGKLHLPNLQVCYVELAALQRCRYLPPENHSSTGPEKQQSANRKCKKSNRTTTCFVGRDAASGDQLFGSNCIYVCCIRRWSRFSPVLLSGCLLESWILAGQPIYCTNKIHMYRPTLDLNYIDLLENPNQIKMLESA